MHLHKGKITVPGLEEEEGIGLWITEPDDLWHANNLISAGDVVYASTWRKVSRTTATGSTVQASTAIKLAVKVASTTFDPLASELRVSGPVMNENSAVSVGQYHSISLKFEKQPIQITLFKNGGWDTVARQMLTEALSEDKPDAIVAVIMQEGLANICLITESRTIVKLRIEHSIPRKRSSTKETSGGMTDFYEKTLSNLLNTIDFSTPRTLLLASPGFVAQDFRSYMKTQADKKGEKALARMAREAVVVHTSTGHVHSLNEVMKSEEVKKTVTDAKFTSETMVMDTFYEMFRKDDGRAWYGVKPVAKAIRDGAVGRGGGILLVNNAFFRVMDVRERQKYVALVDKVKADGGEVRLLSSDHESGKRLDALGGMAAILTYPMYDLDDDDDDEVGSSAHIEGSAEGTTVI
ncbi:hypothetical protein QBC35DRAFT_240360 [Podospora australis]|uniref:Protein DOM34 homolog n=1 Tax=Podospora australis TaxID=1536484 RepID=A0AAN7AIE7_9PEZI|nr:hypothetical protein QBC35DRAFT_240360 [Podospora australis]